VKLLDYESRWAELEESRNPFAIVVMAHLKTKETRKNFEARREWKFRLTRMLYERDYERQDILNLFRFLDWILELPEDLKQGFKADLKCYEEEKKMRYITTIERMGIAEGLEQGLMQGRQEGRQEGGRSLILRLLTRRIGVVPADLTLRIEQLSIEQLEALADALLDFSQVDDLVNWLADRS
jgi:flagellar biosynthesis/type III secretory pathway protein FliH